MEGKLKRERGRKREGGGREGGRKGGRERGGGGREGGRKGGRGGWEEAVVLFP